MNLLKKYRKIGYKIDEVYLVGMGDSQKTVRNSSTTQSHNVSLNLLEQYSLVRAMIFKAVETFLPHADKIILSGVPGNHGEMTRTAKVRS